jgi:hypothetical protein
MTANYEVCYMAANCETCRHLKGIACTHPDLATMPYEKGCSYWEPMEKEKLTAEEIKRGILSKPTKLRIQPVERKITQISANAAGGVWALCDDGSLWFGNKDGWREFEPIPLGVRDVDEPSSNP